MMRVAVSSIREQCERMMHLGGGNGCPWAGPLLAATPGMLTLTLVVCASLREAPGHVNKYFQVLVQKG